MNEIKNFKNIDAIAVKAREVFRENENQTKKDFEEIFFLYFQTIKSIFKFYTPKEWEGSQNELTIGVMIQCLETVLAMYYLSESGFWHNALALKRNYVELFSVSIIIGYEKQAYIDWKNKRNTLKDFGKIIKRIEKSENIPQEEKSFIPILKQYWNEASANNSHNTSLNSIRTLVKSGKIEFEPMVVKKEYLEKRIGALRNMILNLLSLTLGIFNYGEFTEKNSERFPEALNIIGHANSLFKKGKDEWLNEGTT